MLLPSSDAWGGGGQCAPMLLNHCLLHRLVGVRVNRATPKQRENVRGKKKKRNTYRFSSPFQGFDLANLNKNEYSFQNELWFVPFPYPRCDPSTTVQAQPKRFFLSLPNCQFFLLSTHDKIFMYEFTQFYFIPLFPRSQCIKSHMCAVVVVFPRHLYFAINSPHVFTFNKNTRKKVDKNLLRAAHLRKRKKKSTHTHTHTKPIFELKLSPTAIQGQISVTLFCLF